MGSVSSLHNACRTPLPIKMLLTDGKGGGGVYGVGVVGQNVGWCRETLILIDSGSTPT